MSNPSTPHNRSDEVQAHLPQAELEASALRATNIIGPRMKALCEVDGTVTGDGVKIKWETIKGPRNDPEARRELERIEITVIRSTKDGDRFTDLSLHTLAPSAKVSINGQVLTDTSDDLPLVIDLFDKIDALKKKMATPVTRVAQNTGDELRAVLGRL